MKRYAVLGIIIALVVSIAAIGCSNGGNIGPTPQPKTATPTPTTEPPTPTPTLTSTPSTSETPTVYKAIIWLTGSVIAKSNDNSSVSEIMFTISSDESVDMGNIVINYTDEHVYSPNISYMFENLTTGSTTILSPSNIGQITINMVDISDATLGNYDMFTLEVIQTNGVTMVVSRYLPGEITEVMDLH